MPKCYLCGGKVWATAVNGRRKKYLCFKHFNSGFVTLLSAAGYIITTGKVNANGKRTS